MGRLAVEDEEGVTVLVVVNCCSEDVAWLDAKDDDKLLLEGATVELVGVPGSAEELVDRFEGEERVELLAGDPVVVDCPCWEELGTSLAFEVLCCDGAEVDDELELLGGDTVVVVCPCWGELDALLTLELLCDGEEVDKVLLCAGAEE